MQGRPTFLARQWVSVMSRHHFWFMLEVMSWHHCQIVSPSSVILSTAGEKPEWQGRKFPTTGRNLASLGYRGVIIKISITTKTNHNEFHSQGLPLSEPYELYEAADHALPHKYLRNPWSPAAGEFGPVQ